jgi:transcriptional regulator with XRE-family HTH domain
MSKWLFRKQLISEHQLATVDIGTMSKSNSGTVIRRLRQAAGLSQSDLARRLNVHQAHLSRLESGERRLVPETIREVKAAIRASLKERQAAVARLTGSKK